MGTSRSSPSPLRVRLVVFDLLSALVALLLAVLIYRGWRSGLWIHRLGLPFHASLARFAHAHSLPAWVRNSVPDALWQYAFAATMFAVWRGTPCSVAKAIFLTAPIAVGVFVELGQLARVMPGTFDPLDLLASLVAGALAFVVHGGRILTAGRTPSRALRRRDVLPRT